VLMSSWGAVDRFLGHSMAGDVEHIVAQEVLVAGSGQSARAGLTLSWMLAGRPRP